MQALILPKVKLKIAKFDNLTDEVKEKSNKTKFGLDSKFYQKLFVIIFTPCIFLIFPESPKDSQVLCREFYSIAACDIW